MRCLPSCTALDIKNAAHSGEPTECHNTLQQCPAQTSLQSMKSTLWRASSMRRHLLHRIPPSVKCNSSHIQTIKGIHSALWRACGMRRAALLRIQPPVQRIKLCQLGLAARERGVERLVALHAGTGAGTHTAASVTLRTLAAHKRVPDQRSSHTAMSIWFCKFCICHDIQAA